MSFTNLAANGQTFLPTAPFEYHLEGTGFADPNNYVRVRPGSVRKDKALTAGLTRIVEKDVTVASDVTRKGASASLNIVLPKDGSFTDTEIESMVADLAAIATADLINALLQGRF